MNSRCDAAPNDLRQRRHQPVLRFDLVEVGELAALVVVAGERGAVDAPLPRVGGGRVRARARPARARAPAAHDSSRAAMARRRRHCTCASSNDDAALKRGHAERGVVVILARARGREDAGLARLARREEAGLT